jgi:hypothetical protein
MSVIDVHKIIEQFSNLKHITKQTEHIYSNIIYSITNLNFQYHEIMNDINEYTNEEIISAESYNILEENIEHIDEMYEQSLTMYRTELVKHIELLKQKTNEFDVTIFNLDDIMESESPLYSMRLFSVLLSIFVKNFEIMSYDEKVNNLSVLKIEYVKYLKNFKQLNTAFIISHLHPIYVTPILLLSNTEKSIILKDNISNKSVNLSSYYGIISPDFIQFKAVILTPDIRSNLLDDSKQLYEITYNGNIHFFPDYRNKTYEIEIIASSMLISQQKYKIILTENGFPAINPIDFGDSNIKLGKINNNTFELNLRNYYSTSNVLFMIMIESDYSVESNLTYDDIYTYKAEYIDYCNIPTITDKIIITPYIAGGYPILFEEYSNTPVILDVYSSPTKTTNSFAFDVKGVTVFKYDLTLINKWYINVVEESTITFEYITTTHSVPRSNFTDSSKPIVEIDSNILKVNPDYRGETYSIRVNIESPNDYSLCNIIEIEITEDAVPKPVRTVRNLLLEHLLLKEERVFNANRYFTSGTGENLRFEYVVLNIIDYKNDIKLDTLPYDTFEITTSNLRFTPNYRNIGYTLQVYAIDSIYGASSDEVLEINVREDKILNIRSEILGNDELGNHIRRININDHIELPEGQETTYTLTYHESIDKVLRKSKKTGNNALYIIDHELYIDPDYRNDSYNANILVKAYSNLVYKDNINFTFSVSEVIAPYPTIINTNIVIADNNYNKNTKTLYINKLITTGLPPISLDLFFNNEIEDSSTNYQIVVENNECYKIINKNLVITPNVRDITHKFSIMAIDNTYATYNSNESNLLNVEIIELPPIILENDSNFYTLSNNEVYINLNNIFTSVITTDTLEYYITVESDNDIRLNVATFTTSYELNDNILQLYPDYRGISYRLNVLGFNPKYFEQSLTYYIDIIEIDRLPIEQKISNIKINMERFNYDSDNITINLEEIFVNFKYYPQYNFILESDIVNFEEIIYISLGYLTISKFDYEYNFKIKVILFDFDKNINVLNNQIDIHFVKSLITIINTTSQISLKELNEKQRYEILGLNHFDISDFVQLINNKIHITKSTFEYYFVLNTVENDSTIIIEQIFYKVANI